MSPRSFGGTLPNVLHHPNILPELLGDKGVAGISTNASDTAQHPHYISVYHTGHLTHRSPGVSLVWEESGYAPNGVDYGLTWPKAMEAMAPAVYRPTPGRSRCKVSAVRGTWPPSSSTT